MAVRWIPWRWIIRRAARAYGVMDPLTLAARMRRFSQPSEVAEPIELLRAGIVFHARGLVNTRAIQHNLDWVWPYWVVRQFDPADLSFVPRAFSFSHVNLTHRNWTAVGLPDCSELPIVDPRALFTPLHDGWSIDCWLLRRGGEPLLLSRTEQVEQFLELEPTIAVVTRADAGDHGLSLRAEVVREDGIAHARLSAQAHGAPGDRLVFSIRPYNPEGIQFIDRLAPTSRRDGILVNGRVAACMQPTPRSLHFETYERGDVFHALEETADADDTEGVSCSVGMATGAAVFVLDGEGHGEARIDVPLENRREQRVSVPLDWPSAYQDAAGLEIPDDRLRFLFDAARASLVLHSVDEIVPGPYTYRRFWFRDACLIAHALLAAGYTERARQALDRFPAHQKATGYFQSQEGEWDSNGQVLWAYGRFCAITGEAPREEWLDAIHRAVGWLRRKRLPSDAGAGIAGLLPAGFSAEHLGPNDYYYWDDWWAIAGLEEATRLLEAGGRPDAAERARTTARDFREAIDASLATVPRERCGGAMPAAPFRRMDAGAVGTLVCDYPLRLTPAGDEAVLTTVEYLMKNTFHNGGFFQNMIHSGINPYLTLDIAQTLLRAGQPERAWELTRTVADLATPTGQWPEAVHPHTGGGCMGDGQHVWAAAEWLMIMRAVFVREEEGALVIGSGLRPEWLEGDGPLSFGPTGTPFGPVTVRFERTSDGWTAAVEGQWHDAPPRLYCAVPGRQATELPPDARAVAIEPAAA
ncbi:MAG: hypothetical protein WEC99_11275 [Halofilum sp. (in: g-proteobacteria)]